MLIGADVEYFIKNETGTIIPAYDLIPHNKKNPTEVNNIEVYHDNVLVEFNIPPCADINSFKNYLQSGIGILESLVRPNYLDFSAAIKLSADHLKDSRATEFGCEPEYDAYNHSIITRYPNDLQNENLRTSGGHVHISGYKSDAISNKLLYPVFVYMLDLFVGIPSIIVENDSSQQSRRQLFGKAGSYRIKPYGIEYRVLSSWWTKKPESINLIYKLCEFVFKFMNDEMWKKFWEIDSDKIFDGDHNTGYHCFGYDVNDIKRVINECDKFSAEKYFNFVSNFLPNDICKQITKINKGS